MAPRPPASPSRQAKLTSKGSIAKSENGGGGLNGASKGKRPRPDGTDVPPEAKKAKANSTHKAFPANPPEPNEVGGEEENETILEKLEEALEAARKGQASSSSAPPQKGGCVLYWMRMKDIRLKDNKALSFASLKAKELGQPLVILHVFSPGDYKAHDRSPVRIDWVLRNLRLVQEELDTLNIPLAIRTIEKRKTIPHEVLTLAQDLSATHIFANMEYEVDELRRDIKLCELIQDAQSKGEKAPLPSLHHDYVLVKPGTVTTGADKPYSVFSPFHRNWSSKLQADLEDASREYSGPEANEDSARTDKKLADLFASKIPEAIEGFELPSHEYRETVHALFPQGTDAAEEVLRRFTATKAKTGQFAKSPLDGTPADDAKESRLNLYSNGRNFPGIDGGSRLSPYLAAGIISIRACLRAILQLNKGKLPMTRDTGSGSWAQELCFRDFYNHVMVAWPRVSMGRNFLLKYEEVEWDDDAGGERLKAWEEGRTGYPFIDAGMRQMRTQGWMHNRARMATASFLCKTLLINWKEGERIFSRYLIDGDLASNNGGWQWSASTGTDPQPYFRIFNPYNQSTKFDPDGDYIRYFVPELKDVKGKAIHEPHKHLKISEFKATGYPKPIVDHSLARKKAIARFKNPGTTADE